MKKKKVIITIVAIAVVIGIVIGVISVVSSTKGKILVSKDSDYKKLGLSKTSVEQWEDGLRISGEKGNFEWWYFDATLDDDSTLVIVFYTKNPIDINKDLSPIVSVKHTDSQGKIIFEKTITADASEFSASKETCNVQIGSNSFRGDLKDYVIHIEDNDIKADIQLHGTIPPYRANIGRSVFERFGKEHYFAWLNPVPRGTVKGKMIVNGETKMVTGSGYHDHNWGDAPMMKLLHHWYWGRAVVDDYTVISSYLTASDSYGGENWTTFMLARDSEIIASDSQHVTCTLSDIYIDKNTDKPVANKLVYDYNDNINHYRVTYTRNSDISNTKMIDRVDGVKKLIAKMSGFDGAYLRFTGKVKIEKYKENKVIESVTGNSAVWELMYFGQVPKE